MDLSAKIRFVGEFSPHAQNASTTHQGIWNFTGIFYRYVSLHAKLIHAFVINTVHESEGNLALKKNRYTVRQKAIENITLTFTSNLNGY